MNRRVTATLVSTLLALVVGTVWVPTRTHWWVPHGSSDSVPTGAPSYGPVQVDTRVEYRWVWRTALVHPAPRRFSARATLHHMDGTRSVRWYRSVVDTSRLVLTMALLVALGGLLALYFRTRRGAA